jgi:cell division protein FtsQ
VKEAKIENGSQYGKTTAPVYLRLQKRAEGMSRRRRPLALRWWPLTLRILAVVAASFFVAWSAKLVRDDPRFQLHAVELQGGKYLARTEVEEVFLPDRDHSIYQIPLEQRRQAVEQIPWVRSAVVTRILPDQIRVFVEERIPVAFLWTRKGVVLLDAEGVSLDSPPETAFNFPVVRGLSDQERADQRRAKMRRYMSLMGDVRRESASLEEEAISEVDLADPEDLRVVATDAAGAVQLHLGQEKFGDRYGVYARHIRQWRQQFSQIQSIDLRYEGQVVVHAGIPVTIRLEKETASSAPPGAPPSSL